MKKRNNIDLQNPMHTIAGVILGCIFIGLCIYGFYQTKSSFSSSMNQYNSMTMEYAELDKSLYDGMIVSGGEVKKAISKLIEDSAVSVQVKTKANSTGTIYKKDNAYDETDKSEADYINENASFEGQVFRNENGLITKVTFTQQES